MKQPPVPDRRSDPLAQWVKDVLDEQTDKIVARITEQIGPHVAPAPAAREWFTTEQAAQYLGCSRQKLEIDRVHGRGPAYCRPNRNMVRYRRVDLDRYLLQARRQTSEDQK